MKRVIFFIMLLYSDMALSNVLIKGNIVSEVHPIYSENWSKSNPYCFDKNLGKCFPIKLAEVSYLISNLSYDDKTDKKDRTLDLEKYSTAWVPVNLILENYDKKTGSYQYTLLPENKIKFYNAAQMGAKTGFVERNMNLMFPHNEKELKLLGIITYSSNNGGFHLQNKTDNGFIFEKINHELVLKRTKDIPITIEIQSIL